MKIKLPKDVGTELDDFKANGNGLENFYLSLSDNFDTIHCNDYVYATDIVSDHNQRIVNLLNAWCYGWEEE